jgi:aminoglycoside phosphotransferase (APT) family kinase protein
MSAPLIDETLVRGLLRSQFPQWSVLPVLPGDLAGWDNQSFRLGEHLLVRLPTAEEYAAQIEKEHLWLPRLAPSLLRGSSKSSPNLR